MASEIYRQRRRRLFELLPRGSAVLLHNGYAPLRNLPSSTYPFRGVSSVLYLCGSLPQGALALLTAESALLFLDPQSASDLVWDGPQPSWEELAHANLFDAVRPRSQCAECCRQEKQLVALPSISPKAQREVEVLLGRAIGVEDEPLIKAVVTIRLVHDAAALQELRAAVPPTVAAFERARACVRVGATEQMIVAELVAEATRAGMSLSFPPIVSVRGEILHNTVSQGPLCEGALLLVDFGVETPTGFASDVTRTWPVSGRFTARQREIYQLVLEVQERAISAVAPGVEYRAVHEVACRAMLRGFVDIGLMSGEIDSLYERGAHTLAFPHGIGHLIGLDVHDMEEFGDTAGYAPGRVRDSRFGFSFLRLDRPLQAGMVVSIEPGIYFIPALLRCPERRVALAECVDFDAVMRFAEVRGVRIEDEVLVSDGGAELLTAAIPKATNVIETEA